ncbi:MAG: hypothetical protein RLZZ175_1109 [Bacteroidota bacterium]|jgi:NAD-dependent deacetylase
MKNLVVLTGAGISAESGIKTFRDSDGLWEGHDVMEVATPQGFAKNPALVLEFYNQRRKQALEVKPNGGHIGLKDLEKHFNVSIITQNVDSLHEHAGSKNVLHLHGKLDESRSTKNPDLVYKLNSWELNLGDKCELGSQLRPNIVWFGEAVPAIEGAIEIVAKADIFVIIGTSLVVYPAASLIDYVPKKVPVYVIDPNKPSLTNIKHNITFIEEMASVGVEKLKGLII